MKSRTKIASQFRRQLQETQRGLGNQYNNIRQCEAFYAGDTMDYKDSVQFQDSSGQRKKAMVQFNKVKPYVNAVKGFMAQNRRNAKYTARINGDKAQELYSKYCNSLAEYVREEANADQVETQQDGDTLIGGISCIETAMTYTLGQSTTNPNGQIIMGRKSMLQVGYDPFARDTNILDARWVFYEQDFALQDAMDLFDDNDESHFEEAEHAGLGDDAGYKWFARGGRYNKIKEVNLDWTDQAEGMVKLYFYQWFEYETFYRAENPLMNPVTAHKYTHVIPELAMISQSLSDEDRDLFSFDAKAEILTFDGEIKKKLDDIFGEDLVSHDYKRKVFYTAVISKDHVFTAYQNPCQQGFTLKFKTGDWDNKNKIWTGMVNSMIDPSTYYNKALTELMFIIGANSKGGVMYEEGSISDIQKFEQKYAKTDAAVMVADGALVQGRIKPKREPFAPTGYEEIIQISDKGLTDAAGIDKAFLGSSENKQETGLLQSRRIKQVVSSLACYFDSITLYQKDHARLLLDFFRIYVKNNSGGMFKILGNDGKVQFAKISEDRLVTEYDVSIGEAPQSQEEKQEFATIIVGIADKMLTIDPTAAKSLYAIALKYTPLDNIDQQEILRVLMPNNQQIDPKVVQQLQQQIQQLTSDMNQAEIKTKLAKAALDFARIDEVKAAAVEKRAGAAQRVQETVTDAALAHHQLHTNVQEKITL